MGWFTPDTVTSYDPWDDPPNGVWWLGGEPYLLRFGHGSIGEFPSMGENPIPQDGLFQGISHRSKWMMTRATPMTLETSISMIVNGKYRNDISWSVHITIRISHIDTNHNGLLDWHSNVSKPAMPFLVVECHASPSTSRLPRALCSPRNATVPLEDLRRWTLAD